MCMNIFAQIRYIFYLWDSEMCEFPRIHFKLFVCIWPTSFFHKQGALRFPTMWSMWIRMWQNNPKKRRSPSLPSTAPWIALILTRRTISHRISVTNSWPREWSTMSLEDITVAYFAMGKPALVRPPPSWGRHGQSEFCNNIHEQRRSSEVIKCSCPLHPWGHCKTNFQSLRLNLSVSRACSCGSWTICLLSRSMAPWIFQHRNGTLRGSRLQEHECSISGREKFPEDGDLTGWGFWGALQGPDARGAGDMQVAVRVLQR